MTYRHKRSVSSKKNAARSTVLLAGGYLGVVKNWVQDRGFGFINWSGRNVFVHMTQIADDREELDEGETVYFELQEDDKGRLSATKVTTHFNNFGMQHQVQYMQGPGGQIFAVQVNPLQQQMMVQRYNEMVMLQNQATLQRHSPQLQALNAVVSEVPTLAPELPPGLNPGKKPDGEAKPTTKPEAQAAAAPHPSLQQENQTPVSRHMSFQEQQQHLLQAQHFQRLQMFQQQQLVQSQRVVLFPLCFQNAPRPEPTKSFSLAQNIMLNQPATVPGVIQNQPLPNVPATKKTNLHIQQRTNQGPVSQPGATHSFYKAFKPY